MKISFSPPDITEKEIEGVVGALRSGWITTGPKTKAFEKRIASYLGLPEETPNCVCLNSATAALTLSLFLLGIGEAAGGSREDEVITCAYTYTASASIITHAGARTIMVDCTEDPGSLVLDYDALEAAITEHTKAIIPIDLGGIPCDYDRIRAIVEKKKTIFATNGKLQEALGRIAIISDSSHAFGAIRGSVPVGALADFSCFSFHAVKNLTTAEGGALVWRSMDGVEDADIYHRLQLLSLHGQSKDALSKSRAGAWEYDIVGPWFKMNMTDIAAGIGLAQLERYPGLLARRRFLIETYDAALQPLGVETLAHYTDEYTSSGHLYITRIPGITGEQRNEIITRMGEAGIACNVHYKPLPLHTAYKNMGFDIRQYPHAYEKFINEITLPLHTLLTDEEVDYIIQHFVRIIRDYTGNASV